MSNKLILVTGGFSYLHRGHMAVLEYCHNLGEVVVLLNSDESIMRMKGYFGESFNQRKQAILNTRLVKEVRRIEENPESEIEKVKPDVIVVGADHTIEEVLEKGGKYAKRIIVLPESMRLDSSRRIHEAKLRNDRRKD